MKDYETIHSITAVLECHGGISYKVSINFSKNSFVFWEWRGKAFQRPVPVFAPQPAGNLDDFKQEIRSLHIWEWEPTYRKESGIILDGTYWSIQLKTNSKVYRSEGINRFPPNWNQFCKAVERLTGRPFR